MRCLSRRQQESLWFRIRGLNGKQGRVDNKKHMCGLVVQCLWFAVAEGMNDACNKTTRGTELMNCSLNVML
jgi:hypothetical protein